MVDQAKLAREKSLGREAELLLTNPLFKTIFTVLRDEAKEAACTTPGDRPDDIAKREAFRRDVQALDRLKAKLEAVQASGLFAKAQLGDN
jgi:hypothetical protein